MDFRVSTFFATYDKKNVYSNNTITILILLDLEIIAILRNQTKYEIFQISLKYIVKYRFEKIF